MWKSKKLQTFWYLVFNEHHFIRGIKSSISWTFTSHFPCTFRWHRNLLVWGNLQDILRPTGKDPDAWKDWGQEKKGATEDGITDSTDMSLSKLREIAKDIEAQTDMLQFMVSQRVGHTWVSEQEYISVLDLGNVIPPCKSPLRKSLPSHGFLIPQKVSNATNRPLHSHTLKHDC